MERDIVEFAPFNEYGNYTTTLAIKVLEEILNKCYLILNYKTSPPIHIKNLNNLQTGTSLFVINSIKWKCHLI